MKIFNKHAPLKLKRVKSETQPEWHNDEIKLARKKRDAFHKAKNWKEYKAWRNTITSLIRLAKKGFFARSVDGNKNCSYLWKHVKNLNNQSDDRGLPQETVIDNIKSCESNDTVNRLNQYFTSVSERLNSEHSQEDIPFNVTKLNEYIRTKIPENVSFRIPLMKLCELISIVNALDVTKETGLNGITARILKSAATIICSTLLKIINTSFQTGVILDYFKLVKILPTHKGGSKSDPSNYRLISISPCYLKLSKNMSLNI